MRENNYKFRPLPVMSSANLIIRNNNEGKAKVMLNDDIADFQTLSGKNKKINFIILENISENPMLEVKVTINYNNEANYTFFKYHIYLISPNEKHIIPISTIYDNEGVYARHNETSSTLVEYKSLSGQKYRMETDQEGHINIFSTKSTFFNKEILNFNEQANSRYININN